MQYRKDIGRRATNRISQAGDNNTYAKSGVNIDAGNRAVALMTSAVRSTYTPAVLAGIGAFGGLFDASALKSLSRPVLVASTDGVGTKVKLASRVNRYHTIGFAWNTRSLARGTTHSIKVIAYDLSGTALGQATATVAVR
jgi:hypothetical protein